MRTSASRADDASRRLASRSRWAWLVTHRQWSGPGEISTEFHLPHGEWIRLLRENGFEIEALHELQAPENAQDAAYYDYVTADWARKWPTEEIWVARKQ